MLWRPFADFAMGRVRSMPPVSLTKDGNKYTDIGPPLPDFCLQNTCKFAAKSVIVRHSVGRRLPCSFPDRPLHSSVRGAAGGGATGKAALYFPDSYIIVGNETMSVLDKTILFLSLGHIASLAPLPGRPGAFLSALDNYEALY